MKNLFTIGYEGCKAADLFSTLRASGVTLLIDIRDIPISRKPGFSKTALSEGLFSAGISPPPGARRLQARPGRSSGGAPC
jgi:uncharacterized protein (DUF488 family)